MGIGVRPDNERQYSQDTGGHSNIGDDALSQARF
jgi:hypothetical protein